MYYTATTLTDVTVSDLLQWRHNTEQYSHGEPPSSDHIALKDISIKIDRWMEFIQNVAENVHFAAHTHKFSTDNYMIVKTNS